jgi:hypothetical protein
MIVLKSFHTHKTHGVKGEQLSEKKEALLKPKEREWLLAEGFIAEKSEEPISEQAVAGVLDSAQSDESGKSRKGKKGN